MRANFDTGAIKREAHFTNQWARDRNGRWFTLSQAGLTADATAQITPVG